jgi:hypothetical protein
MTEPTITKTFPGVEFTGQVALVTGGSAGLGKAIAIALAHAGCTAVVASRRLESCEQAAAEITAATDRHALGLACDVTDDNDVRRLVDGVITRHGRLDVLVTSAGIQARGVIGDLDATTLRRCLEVNVVGTFLACQAAVPVMRAAGYGRIITLASALGLVGAAGRIGYAGLMASAAILRPAHPRQNRWGVLRSGSTNSIRDAAPGAHRHGGVVVSRSENDRLPNASTATTRPVVSAGAGVRKPVRFPVLSLLVVEHVCRTLGGIRWRSSG